MLMKKSIKKLKNNRYKSKLKGGKPMRIFSNPIIKEINELGHSMTIDEAFELITKYESILGKSQFKQIMEERKKSKSGNAVDETIIKGNQMSKDARIVPAPPPFPPPSFDHNHPLMPGPYGI